MGAGLLGAGSGVRGAVGGTTSGSAKTISDCTSGKFSGMGAERVEGVGPLGAAEVEADSFSVTLQNPNALVMRPAAMDKTRVRKTLLLVMVDRSSQLNLQN